jgi:anhydro-N-acetylmuramic acid kinase
MAAGGQGAPLVPYVDYLLYRDPKLGRVSLNIGGIANVTAIPPAAEPEQVIAFDTGPGNMLIDALVSQFSRGTMGYDRDGRMAASGSVDKELLGELMDSAYLKQPPPKSAGREQFVAEFVAQLLQHGLAPADLVATVTAFTADSVADAMDRFVVPRMPVHQLIVSGGGLRNPELIGRLKRVLPQVEFRVSNDFKIDTDAKEAIAFAVLAHETYHGRPASLPSATGARHPVVLGKLVRPFR